MKSAQLIASRFREVILNGTWVVNTNCKHRLTDLNGELATAKFHSLNTIALLVQHLHYYINGIKNVFKGGHLEIRNKYSFDFAPVRSQKERENF